MKIHDISYPISPNMPVWPGDPPVVIERVSSMEAGAGVNISRISCGVHIGTHVDAPLHFLRDGERVQNLDLYILVGDAVVLEIPSDVSLITAEVIRKAGLAAGTERVLFKTSNQERWKLAPEFQTDFVGISPDGAQYLVDVGVKLVGVDYLSVAPFNNSREPHEIFLKAHLILLEGVYLNKITPGNYMLCCLPLKLIDSEGSPCRAILMELG